MTTPEPTPEDLALDLRALLARWDRPDPYYRLHNPLRDVARAAIRRALAAEAGVAALKARLVAAYDRVAAQAELLSRRAEAGGG